MSTPEEGEADVPDLSALSIKDGSGQPTLGVVLDLHYLQIAASSYSLQTTWSVSALEEALLACCGGGVITVRYACDSEHADSEASARGHGKASLHRQLEAAGYELSLSPSKKMSGAQGATDVDVACSIYDVAGAF